jgi:thioredoxin 1
MLHVNMSDEGLDELVSRSPRPVLAELGAAWCAPCRRLAPVIEAIARDHDGRLEVATIDIDQAQETARRHGVTSVPTVLAFTGGELARVIVAPSRAALRALVAELAP